MKQVVRSQNKEIANPLADIGFFGKTRDEPAEDFRCDDDDDDEHGSEEDNLTIADESLRKPKRKKKENKRKTQGKRRT